MPPILHLMRHGQGMHNAVENGHDIRDPALTEKGRQQCRERGEMLFRGMIKYLIHKRRMVGSEMLIRIDRIAIGLAAEEGVGDL